jgi:hypothetical protein
MLGSQKFNFNNLKKTPKQKLLICLSVHTKIIKRHCCAEKCLKQADPSPSCESVAEHEGDGEAHPGGVAEGGAVVAKLLVQVAQHHQVGRGAGHHTSPA